MWAWRPRGVRSHRNMRLVIKGKNMTEAQAVKSKRASAGKAAVGRLFVLDLSDGSIERADIDGNNRKFIIPKGGTFTPKQLHLDKKGGKLYWSDREGMRVMRSNLDGSQIETLVETGRGDADRGDMTRWCVGIGVDPPRGQIYWTQKGPENPGQGRVCRANIEIPKSENATNPTAIKLLFYTFP